MWLQWPQKPKIGNELSQGCQWFMNSVLKDLSINFQATYIYSSTSRHSVYQVRDRLSV